ncbi:MAG: aspartate kinase [Candidatus Avilachnospira sp.]
MSLIIQKFGGTSVATPEARKSVRHKIEEAVERGDTVVVTVSAMGRNGAPYATDTLLGLADNDKDPIMKSNMDLLMSCGEIISAVTLAEELKKDGYETTVLTGGQAGIITNDDFGDARIIDFRPENMKKYIKEGKLVIVTGFQGMTEDGRVTTLGRGGSDTSASALGVALDADMVEIYTDVEGIMTADPGVVPDARILDFVTYDEVCNLATQGAKVIHPRAVELAKTKNIPLRVASTFSDARGTIIKERDDSMRERLITGITALSGIVQLYIKNEVGDQKRFSELLVDIADEGISLDFINICPREAVFTVKEEDSDRAQEIIRESGFPYSVVGDCCKVSEVGANIQGVPGVMAKIMTALTKEGIEVLQTSDSYTTIWCLIRNKDKDKAVRTLHALFKEEENKTEG